MQEVQLHDLTFVPYIPEERILATIRELAAAIDRDYADDPPLVLAILNGAFVFAADLMRSCAQEYEIAFTRVASYSGTASTGAVEIVVPLRENVSGRRILVVEDIVDSGRTLHFLESYLHDLGATQVDIAALFVKPDAVQFELPITYRGFDIPNDFVVGYGMDYNGLGRGLTGLWTLKKEA